MPRTHYVLKLKRKPQDLVSAMMDAVSGNPSRSVAKDTGWVGKDRGEPQWRLKPTGLVGWHTFREASSWVTPTARVFPEYTVGVVECCPPSR